MHLKVLLLVGLFAVTVTALPNFVKSRVRNENKQRWNKAKLDDNESNTRRNSRRSKAKPEVEEDQVEEPEKPKEKRKYSQKKSQAARKNFQSLPENNETPVVGKRAYSLHKNKKVATDDPAASINTTVSTDVKSEISSTQHQTKPSTVAPQINVVQTNQGPNDNSNDYGGSLNSQSVPANNPTPPPVSVSNTSPQATPQAAESSSSDSPNSGLTVTAISATESQPASPVASSHTSDTSVIPETAVTFAVTTPQAPVPIAIEVVSAAAAVHDPNYG